MDMPSPFADLQTRRARLTRRSRALRSLLATFGLRSSFRLVRG